MSFRIARLGDTISHGGPITSAASRTKCQGQFVARVGDTVNCTLHGAQTITQGASKYRAEGAAVAYVGALCSCGATIATGAPISVTGA